MSSFIYLMTKREFRDCQEMFSSIRIDKYTNKAFQDREVYLVVSGLYSDALLTWMKVKNKRNEFHFTLDDEVIRFLICLYENQKFPSFIVRYESGNLLFDKRTNSYLNISDLAKKKISIQELSTQELEENVRYIIS